MEEVFPMAGTTGEPRYDVVSPLGRSAAKPVPPARRLPGLDGKTLGFVWTIFTHGDVLAAVFEDLLRERYRDMAFVRLPSGKDAKWGDYPDEDFPEVVRAAGVDAVMALVGG